MTIEDQLKNIILARYKSIRAFTIAFEIPYSTVDTMLKKGIKQSGVQTVLRIFDALDLDVESIQAETLSPKAPDAKKMPVQNGQAVSREAVAQALRSVNLLDENGNLSDEDLAFLLSIGEVIRQWLASRERTNDSL